MKNILRRPRLADLSYLVDIDLKCYEDPWDVEKWRTVLMDFALDKLVSIRKQHAGLAVWKFADGVSKILRLGVKPAYQHYGIGSELLRTIEQTTLERGIRTVKFKIPESLCCPSDPADVSAWLGRRGYKATRVCPLEAIFCNLVEDAYIFTKTLEN